MATINVTLARRARNALLALAATATVSAHAATFELVLPSNAPNQNMNFVLVNGDIEKGDFGKFETATKTVQGRTVVVLNSKGGILLDGLAIAQEIRDRGFETEVDENAICASVCGVMWLAGTQRYATPTSHIGFHAASDAKGVESGVGSALIGAFLDHIGLSYSAIIYTMSAPPSGIEWFNMDKAKNLGIPVTTIPLRAALPMATILPPSASGCDIKAPNGAYVLPDAARRGCHLDNDPK
jgi:hypothetical protein